MSKLLEMKRYIKSKGLVKLEELSNIFSTHTDTIEAMLSIFVDRGQIKRQYLTPKCATQCHACHIDQTVLYCWQGRKA